MLLSLSLRDFVIIDALTLHFSSGLTVLTGETGAGKSILLDALGLTLGDRADSRFVRPGAQRAILSAQFSLKNRPHLLAWLTKNTFSSSSNTLVLLRSIDINGRSRAFINGRAATLGQLKILSEGLVNIHSQHAHQSLICPETQRKLLDAYAQSEDLVKELKKAWHSWQHARQVREARLSQAQETEEKRVQLSAQIEELKSLRLSPEEWNTLNHSHHRLAHASELVHGIQSSLEMLSDAEDNCLTRLSQVVTRLIKLTQLDPKLGSTLSLLNAAKAELNEAIHGLRYYIDHIDEDPEALQKVEQRLDTLVSTARKYRCLPQDLTQKQHSLEQQWQQFNVTHNLEALLASEAAHFSHYQQLANQLSQRRQRSADLLSKCISAEMQRLSMHNARFFIALTPLEEASAYGLESIEYRVAPHIGSPLTSLAKTASGGELSRINLSIQVAISQVARVNTLIFDEIDAGIGGHVAEVLGKMLHSLGEQYQVLCVTHLPQVACCGDHHWQVRKEQKNGHTLSDIVPLSYAERIEEIARMLGGSDITPLTLRHAEQMLSAQQGMITTEDIKNHA